MDRKWYGMTVAVGGVLVVCAGSALGVTQVTVAGAALLLVGAVLAVVFDGSR